jgi:hypothetical protein
MASYDFYLIAEIQNTISQRLFSSGKEKETQNINLKFWEHFNGQIFSGSGDRSA